MSYQTYTTEAIVCGTFNRNTADRSYLLFTREAGMLYAEARSVREERSRQRMALQDFSLVRVSLIKGKVNWKIGSIEAKVNFFSSSESKEARGSVVALVKLVRRFCGGEQAAPALFDYIVKALHYLSTSPTQRDFLEKTIQLHILHQLGHADTRAVPPFVLTSAVDCIEQHSTSENLNIIEKAINQAVASSQL